MKALLDWLDERAGLTESLVALARAGAFEAWEPDRRKAAWEAAAEAARKKAEEERRKEAERIKAALEKSLEEIRAFVGEAAQHDDMTLILLDVGDGREDGRARG